MKTPMFIAAALLAVVTQVQAAEHIVHMQSVTPSGESMVMDPAYLKIAKGDTVKFVPADASHNAESYSIPAGAKGFATAIGETATVTFDAEGVYLYKCSPHAMMGMMGVIQVDNATNLDQAKADWEAIKPTVMMNADKVEGYISQIK